MKKIILTLLLLATPVFAHAEIAAKDDLWKIDTKKSKLTFEATQNNSPVQGEFTSFNGDIAFNPEALEKSKVHIEVDMNSVSASYAEVGVTLKSDDWFSAKLFPKAVFEADKFVKTDNKTYTAEGTLTIRDRKVKTQLQFTLDEYSDMTALAKGFALIKRNDFGVGQGDWAKTDSIKDEVKVNFTLYAIK